MKELALGGDGVFPLWSEKSPTSNESVWVLGSLCPWSFFCFFALRHFSPLNPGCLIGIFKMDCYIPPHHITGQYFMPKKHPLLTYLKETAKDGQFERLWKSISLDDVSNIFFVGKLSKGSLNNDMKTGKTWELVHFLEQHLRLVTFRTWNM